MDVEQVTQRSDAVLLRLQCTQDLRRVANVHRHLVVKEEQAAHGCAYLAARQRRFPRPQRLLGECGRTVGRIAVPGADVPNRLVVEGEAFDLR